jgi:hypothetical protein
MIYCIHRVNKIETLKKIGPHFGVEVDIRAKGPQLIMNHDPHVDGDDFREYMKAYRHRFIILNIKEAGIEEEVIGIMKEHGIEDYFLLDVEYPFVYRATRKLGFKKIAVRYSEAEPIEFTLAHRGLVDWVWIDTNTKLPLDESAVAQLKGFSLALVSPDRWGRPQDIPAYKAEIARLGACMDIVMVEESCVGHWK